MLSRVAESLMWMARYLERANSLARIVDATEELFADFVKPEGSGPQGTHVQTRTT